MTTATSQVHHRCSRLPRRGNSPQDTPETMAKAIALVDDVCNAYPGVKVHFTVLAGGAGRGWTCRIDRPFAVGGWAWGEHISRSMYRAVRGALREFEGALR